jgi:hypothetical protein
MSVVTVIKKIATKIVSIVTYPFRAAHQVHAILETGVQDFPATKAAIVCLAKQFEVLGSDALHAIADKGLDFKADLETLADIKALFQFFETEFLPVIEKDFADLKPLISEAEAVPAPGSVPLPQIAAAAPGLHNVVPAQAAGRFSQLAGFCNTGGGRRGSLPFPS